MECTVNWVPGLGMGFVAETGSGHVLVMDGAADGGGRYGIIRGSHRRG